MNPQSMRHLDLVVFMVGYVTTTPLALDIDSA